MSPKVTILVPHYKTHDLTKLCLRLLKKHTDPALIKVIVVDNGSEDESTEYLKTLAGITLIERTKIPNEPVAYSHSRALDVALEQVDTPYVLSIHTDTLVKRPDWLNFLLQHIEQDEKIAGVGSWKLTQKPWYKKIAKSIERKVQLAYYKFLGKTHQHRIEGVGENNFYYLRSHCALYRTELLKQFHLKFSDGDGLAGKYLHKGLEDRGYKMIFLESSKLLPYLDHINHATLVLNPQLGASKKNVNKGQKRIEKTLKKIDAFNILKDNTLDR